MTDHTLTAHRVCTACRGTVTNIDGKRHSKEKLLAIHHDTCPGIFRGAKR